MKTYVVAAMVAASAVLAAPATAATVSQTVTVAPFTGGAIPFSLNSAGDVTISSTEPTLLLLGYSLGTPPSLFGAYFGSGIASLAAGNYLLGYFSLLSEGDVTVSITGDTVVGGISSVPLPASMPLLAGGLALAGGAAMRRRRDKKAA